MGHISSLPGLLKTNIQKPLPRQKCANLLAALDTLYLLLAPIPQQPGSQVGQPASRQTYALSVALSVATYVLILMHVLDSFVGICCRAGS